MVKDVGKRPLKFYLEALVDVDCATAVTAKVMLSSRTRLARVRLRLLEC